MDHITNLSLWFNRERSERVRDVPAMAEVARPHVERYVSDASAFAARKRQQVRPVGPVGWLGKL